MTALMMWPLFVVTSSLAADHSDALATFFGDVVVGHGSAARLVKWSKAPAIRLETMIPDEQNQGLVPSISEQGLYDFLGQHVADLSALSGLPMRLMPRDIGEGGDIVISLAPLTKMRTIDLPGVPARMHRRLLGPGRCFFVVWPGPSATIRKAHIVINSQLENSHIKHCFIEELTQSIGLPNDSELIQPSIFNESKRLTFLSESDRRMIQILYDPNMMNGLSRAEAIEKFLTIFTRSN